MTTETTDQELVSRAWTPPAPSPKSGPVVRRPGPAGPTTLHGFLPFPSTRLRPPGQGLWPEPWGPGPGQGPDALGLVRALGPWVPGPGQWPDALGLATGQGP
jgi:hypothetical protein